MGTRASVLMVNSGVVLYQHYDGDYLENTVKEALKRQERWNDESYLTRIIFSEMIKDHLMDSTGFGIDGGLQTDLEYVIRVDVNKQTVITVDLNKNLKVKYTFSEFIDTNKDTAPNHGLYPPDDDRQPYYDILRSDLDRLGD